MPLTKLSLAGNNKIFTPRESFFYSVEAKVGNSEKGQLRLFPRF
jgi:hypothetical protein